MRFPIIEVTGSPGNRGMTIGKEFTEKIKRTLVNYRKLLQKTTEQRGFPILDEEYCRSFVSRCMPYCEAYAPDLIEEMDGIARGADMPFEDVFLLNGYLDLIDHISAVYPHYFEGGCTSFAVRTEKDGLVTGMTYDLPSFFQEGAIYVRLKGTDYPESVFLTTAGILAGAGCNNAGISLTINKLTPADSAPGVIHPMVVRKILAADKPNKALDAVFTAKRASGFFYLIVDSYGDVFPLETTVERVILMEETNPITHANHYQHELLLYQERRHNSAMGHSILRQKRLAYRLKEIPMTALDCFHALTDHVSHPLSVCEHVADPNNLGSAKTVGAFCVNFERRELLAVIGNPCESGPVTIRL